jgi:tetrahydromethanopterin S-methyltransferase subunit G
MGLFKKRSNDPSEIDRLREEITLMAARIDAADAVKQQLGAQVEGIAARLDEPPPMPPPPTPSVHPDEFRALLARVGELSNRLSVETEPVAPTVSPDQLEEVSARVEHLARRIEQVDTRITAVSNELANQITELSGDLEQLDKGGSDAEMVDRLRDTQLKLANEQARYQIAFRQDLAALADFLRHR